MYRSTIMKRAWTLFRSRYRYTGKGGIPFKAIGRACFASCLKAAWQEARKAAALAAMPADVKARRIESLTSQLGDLIWMDNYRQAQATRTIIEAELTRLAA
jgi:hypothetical protein